MIKRNLKPLSMVADTEISGSELLQKLKEASSQNANSESANSSLLNLNDEAENNNSSNENNNLQQQIDEYTENLNNIPRMESYNANIYMPNIVASGVEISTFNEVKVDDRLTGDLVNYLKGDIVTDKELRNNTSINLTVNNNRLKFINDNLVASGQAVAYYDIYRDNNFNIDGGVYKFYPTVDEATGDVIFDICGVKFTMSYSEYINLVNGDSEKSLRLYIPYDKEVEAGGHISTSGLYYNYIAIKLDTLKIEGIDNLISLSIDTYINGCSTIPNDDGNGEKRVCESNIKIILGLADGTYVNDRLNNIKMDTKFEYETVKGIKISFEFINYPYEYSKARLELTSVEQLVKAGGTKKYKLIK